MRLDKHRFMGATRLALAVGTACASAGAFAQSQEGSGRQASYLGVEQIIVTAQKREQNLQVVPVAVTALTTATLEAKGITNIYDLSGIAPNVMLTAGIGGGQGAYPTIRGAYAQGTAPGSDKAVSLYVDGVYLQPSSGSMFELADIERIEVLKGPQGTLFGRNATGGALSLTTRNPTGVFGVKQSFTYGNYDQFKSKTRIDLPAFGKLSAAVNFLHSERRGDMKNLGAGTVWDYSVATLGKYGRFTSPKNLGDQDTNAVLLAAKLDVTPDFQLVYKFDFTANHFTTTGQGASTTRFVALGPATGGLISGLLAAQPADLRTPISNKRPDAVNNAFTIPGFLRVYGHNLTATYDFNEQFTFKNILAYRKTHIFSSSQLDGIGGLSLQGAPFVVLGNVTTDNERQWSNEAQVTADLSWVDATLGYYHFDNKLQQGALAGVVNPTFLRIPGGVIPRNAGAALTSIHAKSDAVYAQGEFHVLPQVDIVGGVRMTWDKKSGTDNTIAGTPLPFTYKGDKATYLVGLNYRPTDNVMAYIKYGTGYISGGFLATRSYNPETAKSVEGGLKADWFDNRLRTNFAIFHVKYNQLQQTTSGLNLGVPQASQIIFNSGNARARGFELEVTAVPVERITLTAGIGYNDFRFLSIDPRLNVTPRYYQNNTQYPVYRPKWTTDISAQYDTKPFIGDAYLMFRVDANLVSTHFTATSAPFNPPPTPISAIEATKVPDVWTLNGRIALMDLNIAGAETNIAIWGRNLTNNKEVEFSAAYGFLFGATYLRARTYGVDLSFQF